MIIIPDDQDRRRAKRKKERLGRTVKPPKASEMELRRAMGELWYKVLLPASDRIKVLYERNAPVLEIAAEIEAALRTAELEYEKVSDNIIAKWMLGVSQETQRALRSGLSQSLGVDTAWIVDNDEVRTALHTGGLEAANLIRTIPNQFLGKVAQAVADNFAGRKLERGSLTREIQHIGKVTQRRAELIARDQTSKLTATLNETRQTSIGIDEYIWRTSGDQRVSGNPTGLYPDADEDSKFHGDHYHRNGKRFKWSEPPPDGHPGQGGFCRCTAQPVIDPAKIVARAEGRNI